MSESATLNHAEVGLLELPDKGTVAIITVPGRLSDKSDCLNEFGEEIKQVIKIKDLFGVVLNLENCTWIGEQGFVIVILLLRSCENVACFFGDTNHQPKGKYKTMKLDGRAKIYNSEEEAINAVTNTQ